MNILTCFAGRTFAIVHHSLAESGYLDLEADEFEKEPLKGLQESVLGAKHRQVQLTLTRDNVSLMSITDVEKRSGDESSCWLMCQSLTIRANKVVMDGPPFCLDVRMVRDFPEI